MRRVMMILSTVSVLLVSAIVTASCASELKEKGFLANLTTDKGGNVPAGFENAGDMKVLKEGKVLLYGSKSSLSNYVSPALLKTFSEKPEWHTAALDAGQLKSLNDAIKATDFAQVQYNKNAARPSDTDGADMVLEIGIGLDFREIKLWEVKNPESLKPILDSMESCRRSAFNKPD